MSLSFFVIFRKFQGTYESGYQDNSKTPLTFENHSKMNVLWSFKSKPNFLWEILEIKVGFGDDFSK